jgi:hypothetical protein
MARRPRRSGSAGGGGGKGPALWERLEKRPLGLFAIVVVAAGWVVLAVLTFTHVWTLEVTFFLAVGLLTLVLGLLSLFAAFVESRRARPSSLFQLPDWLVDFEDYFRWLTPVAFLFGLVFAHYFWH